MLIRCTRKLLKEMGETNPVARDDGPAGSWYANLIHLDRRKSILFTHSRTLFSFVVPGVRKPEIQQLPSLLMTNLVVVLRAEEIKLEGTVLDLAPQAFAIGRTENRSVLSSMNDLAYQVKVSMEFRGGYPSWSTVKLSHRLNHIPMGALGYRYAIEVLRGWIETETHEPSVIATAGRGEALPLGGKKPVSEPAFSGTAQRRWEGIDPTARLRILNNVWCVRCRRSSSIQLLDGRMKRGDLVLTGVCTVCGGSVARVVERA